MVQLVARFSAFDDPKAKATFLWYLADAPATALGQILPTHAIPKALGTIALDIAITFSLNDGLDGRTGLHADPDGGSELMVWYFSKGMTNLPPHAPRPSVFRANDGRYFFHTPLSATMATQKLDCFR